MTADLIVYNISKLYTPYHKPPVKKEKLREIIMIKDAFIAVKDEMIIAVGSDHYEMYIDSDTSLYNAQGKVCFPGFIDAHTHLVFGGSREHEFADKLEGIPYIEILKKGGGILSSVEMTRNATFEELYEKSLKSLDQMLRFGSTTIEAKSGYGLNLETEIKQLEVAKELNQFHPVDILSTYMGAHAIPIDYKDNHEGYVDQVIEDLKVIKEKELATAVDVFCEDHVFDVNLSRKLLNKAKKLGFDVKLHADEIVSLGGTALAVELEAKSADHLMAASLKDLQELGNSNVIGNLLPSTAFYLNKNYANARMMIDLGVGVAISSDYNPGSTPSENIQFAMQLGALKMKMTPNELLHSVTVNAAYALGLEKKLGILDVGYQGDFLLLDIPNIEYFFYHYGINHVKDVFKKGRLVVKNERVIGRK
ncbi:MAG: imidazolonepropionase [Candidatus Izemoplasmataceae bacterium]